MGVLLLDQASIWRSVPGENLHFEGVAVIAIAYIMYFLLCLVLIRVAHLAIRRWSLQGIAAYAVFFALGFVAFFAMKWLAGEVSGAMVRYWYIAFGVIMVALVVYDRVILEYFERSDL